jgi:hypothetical protein
MRKLLLLFLLACAVPVGADKAPKPKRTVDDKGVVQWTCPNGWVAVYATKKHEKVVCTKDEGSVVTGG